MNPALPSSQISGRGHMRIYVALFLVVLAYGVHDELTKLAAAAAPVGRASAYAHADIPKGYLALYQRAERQHGCKGLSWEVLAAIGKKESDHGRSRLPGVRSGWNRAGAAGPMQFGIGRGRAGNAWATFGRNYDRDRRKSVYDPGDAIPAAAKKLCADGASNPGGVRGALFSYNNSTSYVNGVLRLARRY